MFLLLTAVTALPAANAICSAFLSEECLLEGFYDNTVSNVFLIMPAGCPASYWVGRI